MNKNPDYAPIREKMVAEQIEARGVKDKRVLDAMRKIPRHLFVDTGMLHQAYADNPLPIGHNQTISQPYIVALMTEALKLEEDDKVLEVGTGSGYQAAILAEIAEKVFTVENNSILARRARKLFDELNYHNIVIRIGDGTLGWKEYAPYDKIIVTAAAPELPKPLFEQLKQNGIMVIPEGDRFSQSLKKYKKTDDKFEYENLGLCSFVPLVGREGWKDNSY